MGPEGERGGGLVADISKFRAAHSELLDHLNLWELGLRHPWFIVFSRKGPHTLRVSLIWPPLWQPLGPAFKFELFERSLVQGHWTRFDLNFKACLWAIQLVGAHGGVQGSRAGTSKSLKAIRQSGLRAYSCGTLLDIAMWLAEREKGQR